MSGKIRIAVVDDHPMLRAGVVQTLEESGDFEVVGTGATADEAIRLAEQTSPEVLLLDLDIPGGGLKALAAAAAAHPSTRFVMLTVSENQDSLTQALNLGARGYVLKGVGGRELARILRDVRAGQVYVTPSLATKVVREMAEDPLRTRRSRGAERRFTAREREILDCLATGLSNRGIGEKLRLSEKTVKHYVTGILRKLNVHNRVEAALLAQRSELLKK